MSFHEMNFHDQIMNIAHGANSDIERLIQARETDLTMAYKIGHRDARHAAAEITCGADAYIRALEYALAAIITSADECDVPSDGVGVPLVSVDHRLIEEARGLISSPKGVANQ